MSVNQGHRFALRSDGSSNFHPFECDGPGKCIHCDRRHTGTHDPAVCALCDPEYDMEPNAFYDERILREARNPGQVAFTVYGVAAPSGSKRGHYNKNTGRVIISDANPRSRPWKALVSDAAITAMQTQGPIFEGKLMDGPLALELVFYVPRPKGHFGTGRNAGTVRASAPGYPIVAPDVLKLARGVEDALSGIIYFDDAQIVSETLRKAYGAPARCEVTVSPFTAGMA